MKRKSSRYQRGRDKCMRFSVMLPSDSSGRRESIGSVDSASDSMRLFKDMCRYNESEDDTLSASESEESMEMTSPVEVASHSKSSCLKQHETLPRFSKIQFHQNSIQYGPSHLKKNVNSSTYSRRPHPIDFELHDDSSQDSYQPSFDYGEYFVNSHYNKINPSTILSPSHISVHSGKNFEFSDRISSPEGNDLLSILADAREVADRYLNKSSASRIVWQPETNQKQQISSQNRLPGFDSLLASV